MPDQDVPFAWLGVLAGAISLIAGTGAITTVREVLKRRGEDDPADDTPGEDPAPDSRL